MVLKEKIVNLAFYIQQNIFSKQKKNALHTSKTQRIRHLQTFTARHVKKFFMQQASDINGKPRLSQNPN